MLLLITAMTAPHLCRDSYQIDPDKSGARGAVRRLKRGGGGRGGGRLFSTSSGGYYSKSARGSMSKQYKVRYSSSNQYFRNGRTYQPLYVYYKPGAFTAIVGYYSIRMGRTYYDGYGYNFYYGKYGYYEDSPNEPEPAWKTLVMVIIYAVLACMVMCLVY